LSVLDSLSTTKIPRLDFELTPSCDHGCAHCYNVWTARQGDPQANYPKGQLPTDQYLALMEKVVVDSGAQHITLTGGEPLLRKGALRIIERACLLVETVQLITNGSHVPAETAQAFKRFGLRSVQLTLLSADPKKHNVLKGASCFDDTVRAAVELKDAGVAVQVCFVAMKENWEDFADVVELCFALGIKAISYNRMSPTGGAIHQLQRLMPEVEHLEHNLATAERLGRRWGLQIATAMPIPPCLIRLERYPWVKFGFCSTGSSSPNIVVDANGNVRSCNLSSKILGNLQRMSWAEIMRNPYPREFVRTVPEVCRGCAYERTCRGGCKESAFASFGSMTHSEPLVHLARSARRSVA
jgi:radical SAM protein with 4Fe4S-binding SPASM domain